MRYSPNESNIDRALRIVIGLLLVGVGAASFVGAPVAYLTVGIGVVLIITGAAGLCPLYALLRVSTRAKAN